MKGFLSSVVLFPVLNFILQWMGVHLPVPVLWQKKNDQIIFADKKVLNYAPDFRLRQSNNNAWSVHITVLQATRKGKQQRHKRQAVT